jgi:hypothetical protein
MIWVGTQNVDRTMIWVGKADLAGPILPRIQWSACTNCIDSRGARRAVSGHLLRRMKDAQVSFGIGKKLCVVTLHAVISDAQGFGVTGVGVQWRLQQVVACFKTRAVTAAWTVGVGRGLTSRLGLSQAGAVVNAPLA